MKLLHLGYDICLLFKSVILKFPPWHIAMQTKHILCITIGCVWPNLNGLAVGRKNQLPGKGPLITADPHHVRLWYNFRSTILENDKLWVCSVISLVLVCSSMKQKIQILSLHNVLVASVNVQPLEGRQSHNSTPVRKVKWFSSFWFQCFTCWCLSSYWTLPNRKLVNHK